MSMGNSITLSVSGENLKRMSFSVFVLSFFQLLNLGVVLFFVFEVSSHYL